MTNQYDQREALYDIAVSATTRTLNLGLENKHMMAALAEARNYIACQRPVVGFARKAQAEVLAKIDAAVGETTK